MLAAPPATSYAGGVRGLSATKPAPGRGFDSAAPDVRRYRSHLLAQQDAVLKSVGARATYRYTVAGNGFAVELSAEQAAALARRPGVLTVAKDTPRALTTTATPGQLGLSGRTGVWNQLGGRSKAGRGIVVGVLDSGITPEHPMLAGSKVTRTMPGGVGVPYRTSSGAIAMTKARGGVFTGACQAGPQFPATTCNSTIISARYFGEGFIKNVPVRDRSPYETISPRDGAEHGTHTATTAVGRPVKDVVIDNQHYGPASGMAPDAKLAVYKICWEATSAAAGCNPSDMVKAIEQAVEDGVDVINFSIAGQRETVVDPVELALLSAASAGVFVAVSAGNAGPIESTVIHNSPWVMSVAASTAHRFENTIVLGNGLQLRGASVNRVPLAATGVVRSVDAGVVGAKASDLAFCAPNTLDPAKVTGKVVVCDRGGSITRTAKSGEVARARGAAMILTNPQSGDLVADKSPLPTVHIDVADRTKLLAYLASTSTTHTVRLQVGDTTGLRPSPLPVISNMSARGPALANDGDLLKPDITAPGEDIIAGLAPGPNGGALYGMRSGTSMSSPHIAGLAALIMQAHPRWTPMAVKSAMMTTATDLLDSTGAKADDPFAQGAGLVRPKRFLTPGLVYDSGAKDWLGFLEGQGVKTQSGVASIDASNVNLASIAIGRLVGQQKVTRRVTAVTPGTYRAKISVPGMTATVTPSTLRFTKVGETKTFTVSFVRRRAVLNTYTTGFLSWTGAGRVVRSPIAVKPVDVVVPASVQGTGTAGSLTYKAVLGASPVKVRVSGLVAGASTKGSVVRGRPAQTPVADPSNYVQRVTIPAGTILSRFDLVASENLDMYVFDESDSLVGMSVEDAPTGERLDLTDLPAGTYRIVVNAFAKERGKKAVPFTLRTYSVPSTAAGNLTATPNTLTGRVGASPKVRLTWKGLKAGTPYLGVVRYAAGSTPTVVAIG